MTIFNRHASDRLAAFLDDQLLARDRARVEAHLATCIRCRQDLEEIRLSRLALHELPLTSAPDSLWQSIEAGADSTQTGARRGSFFRQRWQFAVASALLVLLTSGSWIAWRMTRPTWDVLALQGSPLAGNGRVSGKVSVRTGESIRTDSGSRARILVASIGSVVVEPNTVVRLVATGAFEHRLALRSGGISAVISAPPRLFIVDTPAGTAVDLGCEYRLHCDRDGAGTLRVVSGWVALEWKGRESLVPGGASCRTYPGRGPGTPSFDDAPSSFRAAVDAFDGKQAGALESVISHARARDTLSLWHILSQVNPADRVRVYDRMAVLAPPPASVRREQVLALDRETLTKWREELAWIW